MKWIFDLASGEWLYGGAYEPNYNPAIQGLAVLPRHPDRRLERSNGAGAIRSATVQEIAVYDAARAGEREVQQFDGQQMLKALAIWTAQKLNIPPQQAKQEILTIYRGL